MGLARPRPEDPPPRPPGDPPPRVLGDLLDADRAKAPVSETEWVALVQAIAAGDQRALHALYERTHRIVFTLIVRITNSRETAEEVTLDVFHEVWRRASKYDPAGGSVVGWIMNQARSRAIDRVRFEQRKKRAGQPADGPVRALAADDPAESFGVREQGRLLTAFFSELTYGEVAALLNQPLGTIKTRVRSGLAKLRQALARPGEGR